MELLITPSVFSSVLQLGQICCCRADFALKQLKLLLVWDTGVFHLAAPQTGIGKTHSLTPGFCSEPSVKVKIGLLWFFLLSKLWVLQYWDF